MKPPLPAISPAVKLPPPNRGWSARKRQMATVHATVLPVRGIEFPPETIGYRIRTVLLFTFVFLPLFVLAFCLFGWREMRDDARKERD